jgi:hypothetical protein
MKRFEYRSIGAPINRAELDSLGLQGWKLCAIDGAVAWLVRDRNARLLEEQGARHAKERGGK